MSLSHNPNIVLFLENTSARRPLSPSLTVLCLDTQEEKYIALFPLFSVLTWMTGSRLNNRRQKEKEHWTGVEMWNTSNAILFFFFFFLSEVLRGCGQPGKNRQAVCRTGHLWRWSPIGVFLGQLHIRHQRNGSELQSPPTMFLFLYTYGNDVWATVCFFQFPPTIHCETW